MLDDLLKFVLRATHVGPDYREELCLAVKQSPLACSRCRDVCPHRAVTLDRRGRVEIDPVDCTGCGLCVQVCPSQALEAPLSYQPGGALACSKVRGGVQKVHCLGRLAPSDLLRLAGRRERIALARNDCANCAIGTAAIADAIEVVIDEARELASFHDRPFEVELHRTEVFEIEDSPERLSRRELLRGGWRGVQRTAADLLAPLDPGGDETTELPTEMQRRYRVLAASDPDPATPVPWPLPRVADGCILCPVCTEVCPTRAFHREYDDDGTAVLKLDPERCMGCDACTSACPVRVIALDETVPWSELSGGTQTAFARDPDDAPRGSVAR